MKFDMHVHTSEISPCAIVNAAKMTETYKNDGYDGVVITNHIHGYNVNRFGGDFSKFAEEYIKGFQLAKEEGEKIGLKVLLGAEICFSNYCADFLVYGLTENFLKSIDNPCKMTLQEFNKIKGEDILIYQAHPFRNGMSIVNPDDLFGIEVNNGNPRHNSRNDIARLWADKHSLHMVSGSDFHQYEDVGHGGAVFERNIESNTDLIASLKAKDYQLIY